MKKNNKQKGGLNYPPDDDFLRYVKSQVNYLYYSGKFTEKQWHAILVIKQIFDNIE